MNRPSLLDSRISDSRINVPDWKDLYMVALFERDKTKLAGKIAAAQTEIKMLRRKLSRANNLGIDQVDYRNERQALDNALFSLQALANCLLSTPREENKSNTAAAGRLA
jgi:hypothetical protein